MWCIPVVNSPSTPVTAPETIAASLACPRLRPLDRKALRSSNPGRPPMAATTVTAVDGPHPVYTPLHGVRSRLVTICQRYRPPLGRRTPARQTTALTHTSAVAHSITMDNSALKAGETARVTVFIDNTYYPVLRGTGTRLRLDGLDFSQAPGTVLYVTSETVTGGDNYYFDLTPTPNTQNAGGPIRMSIPASGDRPAINLIKTYTADTQRPPLASTNQFSPDGKLGAGDT